MAQPRGKEESITTAPVGASEPSRFQRRRRELHLSLCPRPVPVGCRVRAEAAWRYQPWQCRCPLSPARGLRDALPPRLLPTAAVSGPPTRSSPRLAKPAAAPRAEEGHQRHPEPHTPRRGHSLQTPTTASPRPEQALAAICGTGLQSMAQPPSHGTGLNWGDTGDENRFPGSPRAAQRVPTQGTGCADWQSRHAGNTNLISVHQIRYSTTLPY